MLSHDLVCIFLKVNEVEHFFNELLAICTSFHDYLIDCPFLKIGLFVFLIKSSPYILKISPLSVICIANILSLACLFIFTMVFFYREKCLILDF